MKKTIHCIGRWVRNAAAATFFLMLIWYVSTRSFGYYVKKTNAFGLCEYTAIAEYPSPNRKKIAKIGYSDCGATTNWRTTLVLVDSVSGKEYEGMFGINGKSVDLKIFWDDNGRLLISNFKLADLQWFKQNYLTGVEIELN